MLPPSELDIMSLPVPEWLSEGDYEVTARVSSQGQPLGCGFLQLSLAGDKRRGK